MLKHFYFGSMTAEEAQDMDGAFYFAGNYWHFYVEVDLAEGHTRITDTVGRMLPVDRDHYKELIDALTAADNLQEDYDSLLEDVEEMEADVLAFDMHMSAAGFVSTDRAVIVIEEQ